MNLLELCLIANILVVVAVAQKDAGECRARPGDELIWEYDVRRSYMIGAYQEVEAEYGPSDVIITCIGINSLSDKDNGDVRITAGGMGYNYVKIQFRSKFSRGLRYRVFAYGKPMERHRIKL